VNRAGKIVAFLALKRNTALLLGALVLALTGERLWLGFAPKYLETLGAGVLIIGLFDALQTLLGALYAYPGGWLTDRWGQRRSLLLFNALSLGGYCLVLFWRHWLALVLGAFLFLAWSALSLPTTFTVVATSLEARQHTMGIGVQSMVRRVPMMLGPLFGGWLVERFGWASGVRWALFVCIVFGSLTTVFQWFIVETPSPGSATITPIPGASHEGDRTAAPAGSLPSAGEVGGGYMGGEQVQREHGTFLESTPDFSEEGKYGPARRRQRPSVGGLEAGSSAAGPSSAVGFRAVVNSFTPALRELLVSDILIRFCERIPYAFVILWAMDHSGLDAQQFSYLVAIEMVTAMLCYIPVAHLADKYGRRPFVLVTFMFFTLFPVTLLWAKNFFWLAVAFAVRGLKEFGEPARKALIIGEAAPALRSRTFGAYYLIRDCVVTAGSLFGAWLWSISPRANFIGAAVCGALGTLWFWHCVYRRGEALGASQLLSRR
jgi:MFS family permease